MTKNIISFRCDTNLYATFKEKAGQDGKKIGQKLVEMIGEYVGEQQASVDALVYTRGELWKRRAVRFLVVGENYPRELIRLFGNTVYVPSDAVVKTYILDLAHNHILLSKGTSTKFMYAGPVQSSFSREEESLEMRVRKQYRMLKELGEL